MSCGCSNSTSTACPEVPYPTISPESVPSLIDNLVYALYGTIEKSVSSGRVIWNIPCDPTSSPAEVSGIPREEGEGLLCYIIRVLNEDVAVIPNVMTTNANQTVTGIKTFTQNIIGNVVGDIFASDGTTKILENGTGANATFTGNVTGNVTGNLTGNLTGNVTGNLTGNAGTATTLETARTIAISGAVTGTATSFNGSTNITIPATITSGATITSPLFTGTATGSLTSKVVQGVTDGSTPSISSYIGELLQVNQASTSIATGATVTAITLSLTAGEWEVFGNATFNFSGTTVTANTSIVVGVSDTAATLQTDKQQVIMLPAFTTATLTPAFALVSPKVPVSVSASTPTYLVVKAPTFSAGTITFTATLKARRVR
jgi:hypothetical protein